MAVNFIPALSVASELANDEIMIHYNVVVVVVVVFFQFVHRLSLATRCGLLCV